MENHFYIVLYSGLARSAWTTAACKGLHNSLCFGYALDLAQSHRSHMDRRFRY